MTTALTLSSGRRPDGAAVLTAVGEIDMSNSHTFADALAEAVGAAGEGRLVVDLTGVDYLDSAGLAGLFQHADRIDLLVNPVLNPLLTISGLSELTSVRNA
ncbi:MAG: STAS domain-containing protein [Actinoplanes sp.]